jgi:hypothetical protein
MFLFGLQTLMASPVPLDFDKNTVQFIFTRSGTNYQPFGTCFAVNVRTVCWPKRFDHVVGSGLGFFPQIVFALVPPIPSPKYHLKLPAGCQGPVWYDTRYYVTAKHVVLDEHKSIRPELYFRVNKPNGGVTYISLSADITNKQTRIITHTNVAVDLAVVTAAQPNIVITRSGLQIHPQPSSRPKCISASMLADKSAFQERYIREGDDMFFVGLFTPFAGSIENIPIYRFGHVAMLSPEPVGWVTGKTDLYLMEAACFGGNSGSPAFFHFPSPFRTQMPNPFWLLSRKPLLLAGVVSGYFQDFSEVQIRNTALVPFSAQNVGVTAVVPAYYLKEILYSEEEKRFRKDALGTYFPKGF